MDRILIIDDHPLVRNAIGALFASAFPQSGFCEAASLKDAMNLLATEHDIDLVTLDLDLPDAKQLEALSQLRARFPSIPIAVLSASKDSSLARASLSIGAAAFISKSQKPESLIEALQAIRDCGSYKGIEATEPQEDEKEVMRKVSTLTSQQRAVFKMITEGRQNKQIAYELSISLTTTKAHVSKVLEKLKVFNRTQATILANRFHIFP